MRRWILETLVTWELPVAMQADLGEGLRMDMASMGDCGIARPEVRERDSEGNDIEDWIYGQPPSKTVFVRFMGDRVTSIRQYPQ